MKTVFKNAKIVTPESIINGCVAVENGVITHIGDGSDVPTDGERTDCGGKYLLAGFVDIHCHGGNGFDFMDASPQEMKKIADFHLLHGTTSLLATTLTDGYAALEAALENYRRLEKSGAETSLIGVHLEGPWFSPEQCGAQDVSDMKNPDAEVLKRWLKEYPFVKRVSVAPELAGGMDIGKVGKARGAVMSIGHTDADFETVAHARENGYTLLTHLYSGMKGVTRKNAYRIAGAV